MRASRFPLYLRFVSLVVLSFLASPLSAQFVTTPFVVNDSNDSAVSRARAFLESGNTQSLVMFALHEGASRRGLQFDHSAEAGAGASLTYVYHWQLDARSGSDTVVFHCDPFGTLDGVHVPTKDQTQALVAFTEQVNYIKSKGVETTISFFNDAPAGGETEDKKGKREFSNEVMSWIVNYATNIDGEAALNWELTQYYKVQNPNITPPKHGFDGFRFGLAQPAANRQTATTVEQFRQALPDLLNQAMQRAELTGANAADTNAAEAAISDAVSTCAQITAHDAFLVTTEAGRGAENIDQLGRQFAVCDRIMHFLYKAVPSSPNGQRSIAFSIQPNGRGWRDATGMTVEIGFQNRQSDPPVRESQQFDNYGIIRAQLAEEEVPCPQPPGGALPADRVWREQGEKVSFRFRFDCEHAEIYDIGSHWIVADLTLDRKDISKPKYVGSGPISGCPNGTGKVEIVKWSNAEIVTKIQFPNSVTHECGGLKQGYLLNGTLHIDTQTIKFVPTAP